MSLPKLTPEERQKALAKAQTLRRERAQLRRALKAGKESLPELFAKPFDEILGGMRVIHLLQALPRVGRKRSEQILQAAGIAANKRVAGMSPRQRQALLTLITEKGIRRPKEA